ncbi:DinB family protein [Parafrigoribacterium soli]|uniref:DinB family protein n=1 Tax=Parafrigoribacterium soli TaxID=3144663 RepID=UPI0032ED8E9B
MPITPDTKNWTWVLERTCPECGYDASVVDDDAVGSLLRANAAAWPAVLQRPDVAARPDDSTWSPLEYAAHVRDVFRLAVVRLNLMLEEDDPLYANWDQDATAIEERYNEQEPEVVSRELVDAGSAAAAAFDAVPADARARSGRRSDGARFTVSSFGKYIVHDPVHHLWDVSGGAFSRAG